MSSVKKFLVFFFCVLLIFSLFVGVVLEVSAVPSLYEYYNVGNDDAQGAAGVVWLGQTFTVGASAHTVTSVKLLVFREGVTGNATVSIRATGGDGKPTGGDLTSGTVALPTSSAWTTITLTEYVLAASTKYAIVFRVPDSGGVYADWLDDASAPSYAGGSFCNSGNSGSSWALNTGIDFMFEVYGNPATTNYNFSLSGSCVITSSLSSSKVIEKGLSNAATCSDEYLTIQKNLYRSTTATTTITTLLSTNKSIIVTVVENFFESLTASAALETLKHVSATILDFSGIATVNGVLDIPGLVAAGDNALLFAVLAFIIALAAIAVAIFWRSTDRSQQV